jgi:hypothetical protein
MNEFDNTVVRHMRSKITARQNGRTKPMTVREALLAKQAEVALKGSPYAIRHMLQMDQRATEKEAEQRRLERETWSSIKAAQERRYVIAQAKGESTELILPHPDDIVIDAEGARVIGPRNAADLAACKKTMRLRDLLYLQQGLEGRLRAADKDPEGDQVKPTGPLFLACLLNGALPTRFQLSSAAEVDALWRASTCFTKRELLTLCHRGWREFGGHLPRGAQLPGLGLWLSYFDICLATLTRIHAADGNRREVAEALDEATLRVMEELPLGETGPVPQQLYRERGVI